MLVDKYAILVIGSTVHHQIDQLVKQTLLPVFFRAVPRQQLTMTYLSSRKVEALEDSLLLARYLYTLQKSIIISEPSDSLFGFMERGGANPLATAYERLEKAGKGNQVPEYARAATMAGGLLSPLGRTNSEPHHMTTMSGAARPTLSATMKDFLVKSTRKTIAQVERKQRQEPVEATLARLDAEAGDRFFNGQTWQ